MRGNKTPSVVGTYSAGVQHPHWKGGRIVEPRGYVLIKMPGHPMADLRGYVYEHRLVAMETLGRPLRTDEHVHHRNGDKADNRPENIEVLTRQAHGLKHGNPMKRRLPMGDVSPVTTCMCGCGAMMEAFDKWRRPRKYLHGHHRRAKTDRKSVV